jgi:uncharacterized membrane protein YccC
MNTARRVTARTVDEAECVASVLLAIVLAHWTGASHVSWAAFAGFAVMRGHVAETLLRGVLRMVGTGIGGVLALAIAGALLAHWWSAAIGVAVVGTITLYGAIVGRRAYAWLFFGLTFAMVIFDAIDRPGIALDALVATRVLETAVGTIACVAVSTASTYTLRRRWPAVRTPSPERQPFQPHALRHAAQGGVALALLAVLAARFDVPALAQGAITVMAAMLVPVSGIRSGGLVPVSRRLAERLVGGLGGALLAAATLFAAQGNATILLLGTAFGVALGRHIENGPHTRRYVGTQFVLAVLVTLVPDRWDSATFTPGLERLMGTIIGMAVLEPVLVAWHVIAPLRPWGGAATAGSTDA